MRETFRKYPKLSILQDESGAAALLVALLLLAVLGCLSLVIDIGHIVMVRQELQNAADAGALAGAQSLIPFVGENPPTPDWNSARTIARQTVTANKTDGTPLTDCEIQTGYWNLLSQEFISSGVAPTAIDVPAVSARVARSTGQNSGPVLMTFARVLGINATDVRAESVAMIACPSTLPANGGFPLAINEDLAKKYWNTDFSFKIGSDYHYPQEQAGQWTSFKVDNNDVSTVRDLIYNGNPDSLNINDNIWIQPGTETAVYRDAATKIGQVVVVPVVKTDFNTHAWTPIKAILPLYIEDVKGGSQKYIQAHFVKKRLTPSPNVGGPCYGGYTPPRLVQ